MGTSYAPPAILVKEFPSKTSDKIHEVRISRQDGKMYCTCPGWVSRKTCRHLTEVTKAEILQALVDTCKNGVLGI